MNKLVLALMASVAISGGALAQQQQQQPAPPVPEPPQRTQPEQQQQPQMQQPQTQQQRPGRQDQAAPGSLEPRQVRQIQQALSKKGMKVGVDGKWGPRTEAALRQFQQKQGIQPTGQPDSQTLTALGVTGAPPEGRQQPPRARPGAPPSAQQPGMRQQQQPSVPQPRQRQY